MLNHCSNCEWFQNCITTLFMRSHEGQRKKRDAPRLQTCSGCKAVVYCVSEALIPCPLTSGH